MAELLSLVSICKRFGGVEAVRDVSLDVSAGAIHCLAGENGSGKSTLIKIATGALRPDTGAIVLDGQSHASLSPREGIERGIQVIYQDLALLPNLSVAENIALPAYIAAGRHVFDRRAARRLAMELLERLGVSLDCDQLVGALGSSQKQIVAIARALRRNVRVLFMDEPTASLTWREVATFFGLVKQLTRDGVAVVFVSHKLNEILDIADQVTVLRNGQVVADAPASAFDRAALTAAMTGRAQLWSDAPRVAPPGAAMLEARHLGLRGVFDDVSFAARRGEIVGFAGLLGSGAAEIVAALFGSPASTSGETWVDGQRVIIRGSRAAMQAGVGYVPSDRLRDGLFPRHSIADNIVAASIPAVTTRWRTLDRHAIADRASSMLTGLSIAAPSTATLAGELSGGNQQKVVVGRWLSRRPRVLLLNGPTVGVDVGAKSEIHRLLSNLAEQGTTVVVASDDVPELVSMCQRVFVMRRGRLAAELTAPSITEEQLFREMLA